MFFCDSTWQAEVSSTMITEKVDLAWFSPTQCDIKSKKRVHNHISEIMQCLEVLQAKGLSQYTLGPVV